MTRQGNAGMHGYGSGYGSAFRKFSGFLVQAVREGHVESVRRPMAAAKTTISQLVFVLDPKAADPEGIVRACMARLKAGKGEACWKVYPPDGGAKFIPRTFLLAQLAYRKLRGQYDPPITAPAHNNERQLLVDTQDPDYSFLIGYLANIRSHRLLRKRYGNLPKELRETVPSDMFPAEGRPKGRWLRHAGNLEPETFAFITLGDFTALTGLETIPEEPQGTIVPLRQEAIKSSAIFEIQTLSALAERVRRHDTLRTSSWQELYLKTLLSRLKLPKTLIPLDAIEQEQSEQPRDKAAPRLPSYPRRLDLREALERRRSVLLTGSGGAGKTTALTLLAHQLASQWLKQRRSSKRKEKLARSPAWFPVLLRLDAEQVTEDTEFPELAAQNVLGILSRCTRQELARCGAVAELSPAPLMTPGQMLEHLRDEVVAYFRRDKGGSKKDAFLLDRLDNVGWQARDYVAERLCDWMRASGAHVSFVLTVRSWGWRELPDFLHLELSPLKPHDVRTFLQDVLSGKRADLAWSHMARTPRTLEFYRNPFFLDGMVREWEAADDLQPLATKASVIEAIVRRAAVRKTAEGAISEGIPLVTMDRVLSELGYWQLGALTFGEPRAPTTSREAKLDAVWRRLDELRTSGYRVEDILRHAETLGILLDSGLDEPGSPATFAHDHFRDYYAARHLRRLPPDALIAAVNEALDFFDWDEPILMLIELLEDAQLTSQVISCALDVDAPLGYECAARARCLPGTGVAELLRRVSSNPEAAERPPSLYPPPSHRNRGSLAAALSRLGRKQLIQLSKSEEIPYALRSETLGALVLQGFDLVKEIEGSRPHKDPERVFFGTLFPLQLMGTPEAFRAALSLFDESLAHTEKNSNTRLLLASSASAVGNFQMTGPLDSVLDLLEQTEVEETREAIAFALPRASGASQEVLHRLARLLGEPDEWLVANALEAIGQIGGAKATEVVNNYLQQVLRDRPKTVPGFLLSEALETLLALAPRQALSLLTRLVLDPELLLTDSQIDLCIRLLGDLHAPETFGILVALLETREHAATYGALAQFRTDPRAKDRLLDLMSNHPVPHVQDKAAIALGLMGDPSASDRLLQVIQRPVPPEPDEKTEWPELPLGLLDRPPERRSLKEHRSKCRYVVKALASLRHQKAAPALMSLARGPGVPRELREECLVALGQLGHRPAFDLSLEFIDGELRSGARELMVRLVAGAEMTETRRLLSAMKGVWGKGRGSGKTDRFFDEVGRAAVEVLERKGRRFNETLEGWPWGLPRVEEEPVPPWVARLTAGL